MKIVSISLTAAFLLSLSFANEPPNRELTGLKNYSLKQGLSQVTVQNILQDHQGFLWFSTWDGLNRFDGYHFQIYKNDPDLPSSISGNLITALFEDQSGTLWIGVKNGGLNSLAPDRSSFNHYPVGDQENQPQILAIAEDALGVLWVGTWRGLYKLDKNTGKIVPSQYQPSNQNILTLMPNGKELWMGTREGIHILHLETGETQHQSLMVEGPPNPNLNAVISLYKTRSGVIYAGTTKGLCRLSPSLESFTLLRNPDQTNHRVRAILEDDSGRLWTSSGGVINMLDPTEGIVKPMGLSAKNEPYNTLYQDMSGLLWFGTDTKGVFSWDPDTTRFQNHHIAMPRSIMELDGETLLIGTQKQGLLLYNPTTGTFKPHPQNHSLKTQSTRVTVIDPSGTLWVGTHEGLYALEPGSDSFKAYDHRQNIPINLVKTLLISRDGSLWTGVSLHGLYVKDNNDRHFTRLPDRASDPNGIAGQEFSVLFEDSRSRLWVGTDDNGFNLSNPEKNQFRHFRKKSGDGLIHNAVLSICEDETGQFWLGTRGGLSLFDPEAEQFTHWREKDGLPNNTVYSILPWKNNLWLSTNMGISRFEPQTGTFMNYDTGDGLSHSEFNHGPKLAGKNGRLYFGSVDSLVSFLPESLTTSQFQPRLTITDFMLSHQPISHHQEGSPLNQPIEATRAIELNHMQSAFTLHFSSLDFAQPNQNQYAYQLEGYNDDWVQTTAAARVASYTNLDPRPYIFKVKGSNKDGIWSDQIATLRIVIKPAWWQTLWARGLFLLAISLFILGLFFAWDQKRKLSMQQTVNTQLKEVDKLKDDFLANTSHELRTPLNGIIGIAEALIDGVAGNLPEQARSHLQLILSSGLRLTHLVNDILDFSKLKHRNLRLRLGPVNLRSLGDIVLIHCQTMAMGKDLKIVNNIPLDLPAAHGDENRLLQIFYNLVGNAVKFTESGSVKFEAEQKDTFLHVSIIDTGVGIPEDQLEAIFQSFEQTDVTQQYGGTGLGLTVTRQLVELHGGTIRAQSVLHEGSTFIFSVPVSSTSILKEASQSREPSLPTPIPLENAAPIPDHIHLPAGGPEFKILIVDDEPVNRQVLFNHLALPNYRLTGAKNGENALEVFQSAGPFDLILLDIMMPGMNGYEVCKQLRDTYPTHTLPIIFLTAKNQIEDVIQAFNAGGNDYLSKPVAKAELLARVNTQLSLLHINRNLDNLVQDQTRELLDKNRKLQSTTHDLDNKNKELTSLLEIIKTINMETILPSLREDLLAHGMKLFPAADKALLFIRSGNVFTVAAAVGYNTSEFKQHRLLTQELTDLYRGRSTALHRGVYLNKVVGASARAPVYAPFHPLHSLLAMAINRENRLEGVLMLINATGEQCFEASDVGRMERFRQHAANALGRTWLFEELEHHRMDAATGIRRAQQLQAALKPPSHFFNNLFPQHFIFQKSASTVSGDFLFATQNKGSIYLALIDCGGGGISGAITGIMVTCLLRTIFEHQEETSPHRLLQSLIAALEEIAEGSPVHLRIIPNILRLHPPSKRLEYASAGMPLYLVSPTENGTLKSLESDAMTLNADREPNSRELTWTPGDMVYLSTDGFQAQVNSDGKAFGRSSYEALLLNISQRRMTRQKEMLSGALANHRVLEKPTDDTLVVGLELPS